MWHSVAPRMTRGANGSANMRNFTPTARIGWGTIAVLATISVSETGAYAQSDEDAVKAAVTAYNAAVDSLDPAKMEALWAHDDTVTDLEPRAKAIVIGWDGVKKNIEGFFPAFTEIKNTLVDGPYVQIKGDVARSIAINSVAFKLKNGTAASERVSLTDVFEKRSGGWVLVSHSVAEMPK